MRTRGRPVTLKNDDLLDVARAVFLSRGLDASAAAIAKRARISESVIFHRYKTKEALFAAVFERQMVVPPALGRLPSLVGEGVVDENLFDAGMGIVAMMQDVLPFLMMCLSSARMNVVGKRAWQPHPLRRQMLEFISSYFEREAKAGRLRPVKGEVLARMFLGGIMQYVMSKHIERAADPLGVPAFLRGLVDVLLHGTALRESPGRSGRKTLQRRR